MVEDISKEEIQDLLREAKKIGNELSQKLSKIKIHVNGSESPEIIKAIRTIFGDHYIGSKGNSAITYEMYCYVIDLMREVGKAKAEEAL